MWLASIGLHSLLLLMPIPSSETPTTKKPQELVKLTSVTPSPPPVNRVVKTTPTPVASSRPKVQQKVLAIKPTPPTVAKSPRPVVAPSPQKPTSPIAIAPPQQTEIELDPKNQELLPPPQVIPSGAPSTATIATKEINGVPVDPSWQVVEQPNEVMAEAQMFTQPNGKLNPDIVGKVAQIPDKSPDTVFEEFFRLQLAIANFTVEPSGTYVAGGGLYKLTPKGSDLPLYLALAPDKQGTGTVVTIWNKYPSPVESTEIKVLN